jgi:hypothetical protein
MDLKPRLAEGQSPRLSKPRSRVRRALGVMRLGRRGTLLVEFAIVGPIFFLLLFFALDTAYDMFLQGLLDTAVQATARDIQVGAPVPGTAYQATTRTLLETQLCDNALGFLNCTAGTGTTGNIFVRVERINTTSCPGGDGIADLYDATDGRMPQSNGALQLALYGGSGSASYQGPTTCDNTGAADSGFCIAGPSSDGAPEVIVLSAVYIAPSFLRGLAPFPITYAGSAVKAQFSSSAFITEAFTPSLPGGVTSTC